MKKISTLLAIAAMAFAPAIAPAKTVTFSTDNPDAVYLFDTGSYNYYAFNGGQSSITVELSEYAGVNVTANSGFMLTGITVGDNPIYVSPESTYLSSSDMPDGCTVEITTALKEMARIYVVADPEQVSITENYSNVYDASNMVDGKWEIQLTNEYGNLNFHCKDDYVLSSIKDSTGQDILQSYQAYKNEVSMYVGSFTSGETYTVTCSTLTELRTLHVSINVMDGTADEIQVMRNGSGEPVPASEFTNLALAPEFELPLSISSPVYGKSLYKVDVNGVAQEAQGSQFLLYSLSDGDIINVYPNFPDVDVPVTLTFTNEGTAGAISSISVNNENLNPDVWTTGHFNVKLGSSFGISFNTSDYQISSVTANGMPVNTYGYQTSITDETGLNIVVTAEKLRDYNVTLYYAPGTIKAYLGYDSSNLIDLPDTGEASFEVSPSNNYLHIEPLDDYVITDIVDANNNTLYNPVYVSGDMEISVYAERLERNNMCVLYLEENLDWDYRQVILSPQSVDIRKEIEVNPGYNFINYSNVDLPFGLGFYPYADVYLNGEKIENEYGTYPALANMEQNSVLKVFEEGTTVDTYNVTFTEDSYMPEILADYVDPIASREVQVFGPTDLLFLVPVPTNSDIEGSLVIKVNGQSISPDSYGNYVARISSDATISVQQVQVGIDYIGEEIGDAVIYNLQGMPVTNPSNGIFIRNGKKIRL